MEEELRRRVGQVMRQIRSIWLLFLNYGCPVTVALFDFLFEVVRDHARIAHHSHLSQACQAEHTILVLNVLFRVDVIRKARSVEVVQKRLVYHLWQANNFNLIKKDHFRFEILLAKCRSCGSLRWTKCKDQMRFSSPQKSQSSRWQNRTCSTKSCQRWLEKYKKEVTKKTINLAFWFVRVGYLCKEPQGKPNKCPTLSRLLSRICLDISLCRCPRFVEWPRALENHTQTQGNREKRSNLWQ